MNTDYLSKCGFKSSLLCSFFIFLMQTPKLNASMLFYGFNLDDAASILTFLQNCLTMFDFLMNENEALKATMNSCCVKFNLTSLLWMGIFFLSFSLNLTLTLLTSTNLLFIFWLILSSYLFDKLLLHRKKDILYVGVNRLEQYVLISYQFTIKIKAATQQ